MEKSKHEIRTRVLPAIAAVVALSSTPVLAQQTQAPPPDAETPSTTAVPPAESPPVASDTATTSSAPADQVAPAPGAAESSGASLAAPKITNKAKKMSGAKVGSTVARNSRSTRALTHARVQTLASRGAPAGQATPAPSADRSPPSPAPVVSFNSPPAARPTTRPVTNPQQHNETLPIAAGGVLALVGLGGLAFAMKRRREDDAEERTSDEFLDPDTPSASMAADQDSESLARREDSPIIAPPLSAFKWNGTDQSRDEETLVARDDREKGESWVERAYRGPSPLNPSVSLKARLKRAAFFDKRERDAAAGLAQPVDPTAGLPDRMVEDEQNERNREFA